MREESQVQAHFPRGRRTLLYFVSLWGEWFDWEKIEYVARHCPKVTINLIGDDTGCREKKWRLPSNVYFLGMKKQAELPAAIIPQFIKPPYHR